MVEDEIFIPAKLEEITNGNMKGYICVRCLCGRLIPIAKKDAELLKKLESLK